MVSRDKEKENLLIWAAINEEKSEVIPANLDTPKY